jgi:putative hemolysin
MAEIIGGFYSSAEFDLTRILSLPGKMIEIGRTCIHKDYRKGSTVSLLWTGIASVMETYKVDYLIGCASIPMGERGEYARSVLQLIGLNGDVPEAMRVIPKTPLPDPGPTEIMHEVSVPPLIKGYLRVGATICGEPCWDPEFKVADLFIFLDRKNIDHRYRKHFLTLRQNKYPNLKKAS